MSNDCQSRFSYQYSENFYFGINYRNTLAARELKLFMPGYYCIMPCGNPRHLHGPRE